MKTLREYIDLITEAPATDAPTKSFGTAAPAATAPAPVATAPAATAPAPSTAPHRYTPGATWNKGVLGIGSTGPEVDKLRQQLGLAPNGGKFDNQTRDAVIQRQRELGVTADGAWGPGTARADAAKPKQISTPSAPMAPATGANDGNAGDAEATANQNRMTAPMATANDGNDGEAEATAYQNRVPTASTGANDGNAGEAEAGANQNAATPAATDGDEMSYDDIVNTVNNNGKMTGIAQPPQAAPARPGQVWTEGSGYDEVQRIVSLVHYR